MLRADLQGGWRLDVEKIRMVMEIRLGFRIRIIYKGIGLWVMGFGLDPNRVMGKIRNGFG